MSIDPPLLIELNYEVSQLAAARARLKEALTRKDLMFEEVMHSPAYMQAADEASAASEQVLIIDKAVRDMAVALWTTFNDKHPHPAIGVQIRQTPQYDTSAALFWAREHLIRAIKPETLDKSFFEKHARAVQETDPIELITWINIPVATITEDLSEYLPGRATDEEKAAGSFPASGHASEEDEVPF